MPRTRINFISWLWSLAVWDGLLPVGIVLLPMLVQFLFPNRRGPVELIAVIVPVAALLLRMRAGNRRIWENHCTAGFQSFQLTAFLLGIFILFIFDAVIILMHIMPAGAFTLGELRGIAILFGVYYLFMIFAMYPGREPVQDCDL
jgi:hypothetical protein